MKILNRETPRLADDTRKVAPKIAAAIGITALLALGACHTTAGAGQDISAAGHAISHGAEEHPPY
jgi:predicted small secreted protein